MLSPPLERRMTRLPNVIIIVVVLDSSTPVRRFPLTSRKVRQAASILPATRPFACTLFLLIPGSAAPAVHLVTCLASSSCDDRAANVLCENRKDEGGQGHKMNRRRGDGMEKAVPGPGILDSAPCRACVDRSTRTLTSFFRHIEAGFKNKRETASLERGSKRSVP